MSVRVSLHAAACLIALATLAEPGNARAGLFRAYVSSTGNDGNPCTLPLPCRLLPAALAKVNDGGEIWMLDSANYNTTEVPVGKSVTILAVPGALGSVVGPDGHNAVTISALGIKVTLRNLVIVGSGGAPSHGISFLQGAELNVQDCEIFSRFNSAIFAAASDAKVNVRNTVLRDNSAYGFRAQGAVTAVLDGVRSTGNQVGVQADDGASVNVSNSVLANNSVTGAAVFAGGPRETQMVLARSTISGNTNAISVGAYPGASASVVSDGNVLTYASNFVFSFAGRGGSEVIWTRNNNTVGYFATAVTPGFSLTPLAVY